MAIGKSSSCARGHQLSRGQDVEARQPNEGWDKDRDRDRDTWVGQGQVIFFLGSRWDAISP